MCENLKLLSLPELCKMLNVSRSTIYRWCELCDEGYSPYTDNKDENVSDFPKPFKIGRSYKWNEVEIMEWLESKRV